MPDFSLFTDASSLFAKYQISLSENQHHLLDAYAKLMISESKFQNITAVTDYQEIWIRHFLDSAYLLRFLPDSGCLIDIGTGAGIPAIPIAIFRPDLKVFMLDSEEHKVDFCRNVVSDLGLSAECICGRAEELAKSASYRASFDIATSRAMANGSMLTELSVPFLKKGGKLFAMKGKNYDASVERFAEAAAALSSRIELPIHSYEIEGECKHLICVTKMSDTPDQYPRRFAKIKRNPL